MVRSITDILDRPLGRVIVLLVSVGLIYIVATAYPLARPAIMRLLTLTIVVFGFSRLFIYEPGDTLTLIAGCLLVVGGITRSLSQLIQMTEFTGAVANIIPLVGFFVEMYAHHYRNQSE